MQTDKAESWLQEYTKEEQVAIMTMLLHYVFRAMIEATMASYANEIKELKKRV
jgi:hypothetical protein